MKEDDPIVLKLFLGSKTLDSTVLSRFLFKVDAICKAISGGKINAKHTIATPPTKLIKTENMGIPRQAMTVNK
jgi:hypothetical protein